MGNIVKIKGIVGFCGTDEKTKKENLQLYLEENNDASKELEAMLKLNRKIQSTITKIDPDKVKLIDLDLSKYKFKCTVKNAIGEAKLLNLTGETIDLSDIKSGDEVAAIVEIYTANFENKVYGSLKMLNVVKLRSKVYQFSIKSKSELEEEAKESDRLLQEIISAEQANESYSDQTEL